MNEPVQPVASLYVHVPFCAHKCEYCAFYSAPPAGDQVNRYVDALIRELELVAPQLRPTTVFFGGGTPSLLTLRQWEKVLQAMERLKLLGAAEWTVECNPATISLDKARLLRGLGVNRLSLGVQSLDEQLLDRLGRVHSREMVFKSFDLMRQAGFDNLNVDLMFAIPGQTMSIWQATLAEAIALGSEHLSTYEVTYEEDTPLFAQLHAGEFTVDEDLADDMYQALLDVAAEAGFQQYEISNFARDRIPRSPIGGEGQGEGASAFEWSESIPTASEHGAPAPQRLQTFAPAATLDRRALMASEIPSRACCHNINYWRGGAFFGLGPSAASFVGGVRTKNWSNTNLYCEQLEKGRRAIESTDALPPLRRAGEIAAFGLRMNIGWQFVEFQRITGFDLRQNWAAEMDRLVALGNAVRDEHGFHLTRQGLRFADQAAEYFLR